MFPYITFDLVIQLNMLAICKMVDIKMNTFGSDQSIVIYIAVI